ncbi:NAD(P)-dependent oxidoreductase [Methylocapsa palsarum]|uniref:Phosphoglycerate dehydrogenase n=1 Tax=Methylocapsa palsarum TaxID=1612308 RepID=A0A1I3XS77_9HYPH|nr:NAD(P)-dependent oxidoreductase [Methylocapsa palsarum]SFK22333.1 Phosphoglycerate dehydrogenase [Methylocapsa palsarum]
MNDIPSEPQKTVRSPLIVNQGGAKIGELLAAHWSRPQIIEHPKGALGWEVPPQADVLITQVSAFRGAPDSPPPGWPFGLRMIQIMSAGVDPFPPWLFEGRIASCARGVAAIPIAEFVLATILAFEKDFEAIRVRDRSQWKMRPLGSLHGKCLGLAGYGALGRAIADRARPFGMRIVALTREPRPLDEGVEGAGDLASLVGVADHLVLVLPLTPRTRKILDAPALAHAKPGLHVVNVARGALIDQDALLAALDEGRIAGASLDVTDPEPAPEGHPFYSHPKIRLTPHISWGDLRATDRLAAKILTNLDHYVRGEPVEDIVDPARGY